ncbi:hypothetical protein LZ30DRAFT_584203, partial [Colletotrichum cereale]
DVVDSEVAEILVPVRSVVEVDSLKLLDCVVAVVSVVVEEADVFSSDEVTEAAADELTLDERLSAAEGSTSDEMLMLPVELRDSADVVKLMGPVEELDSEVVKRSDEVLDSVEVLGAIERLVSLELLRSDEPEVDAAIVLVSREEIDSDEDVAVAIEP